MDYPIGMPNANEDSTDDTKNDTIKTSERETVVGNKKADGSSSSLYRVYNTRSKYIGELEDFIADLQNEILCLKIENTKLNEDMKTQNQVYNLEVHELTVKIEDLNNLLELKTAEAVEFHQMFVQAKEIYYTLRGECKVGQQKLTNTFKEVEDRYRQVISDYQSKWKAEAEANIALRKEILELKFGKDAVAKVANE